ncbi:MAG: ethylbenzene dehydrogenase-related protein [Phycisphaerae bacterium]
MNSHDPKSRLTVMLGDRGVYVLCSALAIGACAASNGMSDSMRDTNNEVHNATHADVATLPAGGDAIVADSAGSAEPPTAVAPSTDRMSGDAPRGSRRPQTTVVDTTMSRGQELYVKYCALCHGENGDGGGKFAYLMNPRPRNFLEGRFKLATTENQIPSDEDLFRTISNGMPGSAMPPWAHLPKADIDALVAYVRRFHIDATREVLQQWVREGRIGEDELAEVLTERTTPGPALVVAPEPPFDEIRWFRGRRLYLENCASCHGADGEPVAEQVKFDEQGYPVPPRSFVQGIFKGGSQGHQLFARIWKGMKGTPMPASEGVYSGGEMWDIIHYVQSLMRQGAQERAQLKQRTFVAPRVRGSLPQSPLDSSWEQARPLYVGLTPLWWEEKRIEGLVVRALHNGEELAILLSWIDPTMDDSAVKHTEFRDAVAIQFSLSSDPPFYMGSAGEHGGVNIWMWKADRETNIERGYQDVDAAFPARVVDDYPERQAKTTDKLASQWLHAPINKHDPQFITAWGAGNLVADPTLKTPVECLVARGPGTLSGKPVDAQVVKGQAVYERGLWYVQLQRSMDPLLEHDHGTGGTSDERVFKPGDYLPVSFAIWNGSAGDRDGKKNISIWQKLVIE